MLKQVLSHDGSNVGDNIENQRAQGSPASACAGVSTWIGDTSYISAFDNTLEMPGMLNETYEVLRQDFEKLKKLTKIFTGIF
jgi:hypothetical protein